MANRFPLIIDTTNGNQFAELPPNDNLILTNSSIVNALNIEAIGTVSAGQLIIGGEIFRRSYNDLTDTPDIPDNILDLVNDGSAGQVLTTNGSGIVSFQSLPPADPAVGGDLSGTVSNSSIRPNTISVVELDVDEGTIGQVLATDGSGNLQFIDMSGGTGEGGGATSFLGLSGQIGLTQIDDDFITEEKLHIANVGNEGEYLTINGSGVLEYRELPTTVDYNDLSNTPIIPNDLTDLGILPGSVGQVLTSNGNGNFTFTTLDTIENIEFSGTSITTTLNNSNIALDPKGIGYVSVLGTNGLVIPKGSSVDRSSFGVEGAIRLNTTTGQFEGYSSSNWSSLGGVRSVDGLTYINAETTPGASDDTIRMFTNGQESVTLDSDLLELNQNVQLRINSTESATVLGTGALSVNGGISVRGNLLVSGKLDVDETFDTSVVAEVTMTAGELTSIASVSSEDIEFFKPGQSVIIYGASVDQIAQDTSNLTLDLTRIGFTTPDASGDESTFSYRIAQMDTRNGKISPSSLAETITIEAAEKEFFNNSQNIQLTVSRQSVFHTVLVYRKVDTETNYKLIKVLGPKELGASLSNIVWTDYYDFDLVDWSKKDPSNAFTEDSGIIHVPLTAPGNSINGIFETQISEIDLVDNQLTFVDSFYAESTGSIVIDDTALVQLKIDQAKVQNRNSLILDNRTYYVKNLTIPSDFTLEGQGDQTRIIKQYWSTDITSGSNAIIDVDTETYATQNNISIKHLRIDGNSQNQYLANDANVPYLNYIVRVFGNDILFENVEIANTIGGGIWAYDNSITENLTVLNCEITNGGLTYVYDYSPLVATESRITKIAHNTFQDFPDAVYVDAVQKGIITPNVIDNCGSGLFAYGASKIILTPNVLLGPAGEFLANPDVLNSEYNSVNIQLERNIDFNSPSYVYQENGELFDFTANQGMLTAYINELSKTNNIEELVTDYSQTAAGQNYIEFTNPGDTNGGFSFRIVESKVNDLLSRTAISTLLSTNPATQGLVYRIIATEYVPSTNISSATSGTIGQGSTYIVSVDNATRFSAGTIVRLVDHTTSPDTGDLDATVTEINITNTQTGAGTITIDYGNSITGGLTEPGISGTLAIKNNFVVAKGKIN